MGEGTNVNLIVSAPLQGDFSVNKHADEYAGIHVDNFASIIADNNGK